jgi:hypothetical protein
MLHSRLHLLVALLGFAVASRAAAHHSHGNYDVTHWIPIEGTVKEVNLLSPHSWVYLEVAGKGGEPEVWALEATFPRWLVRNGIKPEDVRPGDLIKVRCHQLRDGGNGCLLGYVTPMHGDPARGHGVEKEWD